MSDTRTESLSSPMETSAVRELKPGFGAEVQGLDFSDGVTDEKYRLIEELYGVVVLRKTNLNDETHLELARILGELDDMTPHLKAGRRNRLKYVELFDISNMNFDGTIIDPEGARAQVNRGNDLFHVDSSFNPRRAGFSLLLAHELPYGLESAHPC